jgi:hypothetical protein
MGRCNLSRASGTVGTPVMVPATCRRSACKSLERCAKGLLRRSQVGPMQHCPWRLGYVVPWLLLAGLTTLAAGAGVSVTNRIPFSVNSVVSLSVVDVLQDHHSERFLDMIIPAYPALPQAISRVNTNTCFIQAQKCLDESTKPHSKLKAEWLALAERWIKTAEELTN